MPVVRERPPEMIENGRIYASRSGRYRSGRTRVVCLPVQLSPVSMLPYTTPLLEKEGNLSFLALRANGRDPSLLHRTSAGAAFTTDDDPMDAGKIDSADVLEKRLNRQEAGFCRCCLEVRNTRHSMLPIFDAHSPPH